MRAPVALASAILLVFVMLSGVSSTRVAAAASSSTGTLTGAIVDITPDSGSGLLPGIVELLTPRGRLIASQHVRAGHSFRLAASAGRCRLTSTEPCSVSTLVVIHAGQATHRNIALTDCGP